MELGREMELGKYSVKSLKGTLKSNRTLNNNHLYRVKMIVTIENKH